MYVYCVQYFTIYDTILPLVWLYAEGFYFASFLRYQNNPNIRPKNICFTMMFVHVQTNTCIASSTRRYDSHKIELIKYIFYYKRLLLLKREPSMHCAQNRIHFFIWMDIVERHMLYYILIRPAPKLW